MQNFFLRNYGDYFFTNWAMLILVFIRKSLQIQWRPKKKTFQINWMDLVITNVISNAIEFSVAKLKRAVTY